MIFLLYYLPVKTKNGIAVGSLRVENGEAVAQWKEPCEAVYLLADGGAVRVAPAERVRAAQVDALVGVENGRLRFKAVLPHCNASESELLQRIPKPVRTADSKASARSAAAEPAPSEPPPWWHTLEVCAETKGPPLQRTVPETAAAKPDKAAAPLSEPPSCRRTLEVCAETKGPPLQRTVPETAAAKPDKAAAPLSERQEHCENPMTVPSVAAEAVAAENPGAMPPHTAQALPDAEYDGVKMSQTSDAASVRIEETASDTASFMRLQAVAAACYQRLETSVPPMHRGYGVCTDDMVQKWDKPIRQENKKTGSIPIPPTARALQWAQEAERVMHGGCKAKKEGNEPKGLGWDRERDSAAGNEWECFARAFPQAAWKQVRLRNGIMAWEGLWEHEGERIRIHAVRASYTARPPKQLAGFTRYLKTRNGGYWLRLSPCAEPESPHP